MDLEDGKRSKGAEHSGRGNHLSRSGEQGIWEIRCNPYVWAGETSRAKRGVLNVTPVSLDLPETV